jgi:catalase
MADRSPPTTSASITAGDNQNRRAASPHGPLLVQDWQIFEKPTHFNRARIPARGTHATSMATHAS